VPIGGGIVTRVATLDERSPVMYAPPPSHDGRWIYYSTEANESAGTDLLRWAGVMRVDTRSSLPAVSQVVVPTGTIPGQAYDLEVDDHCVYLSTSHDSVVKGKIFKIPKGGMHAGAI
jgi:hypothetical protein